MACAVVMTIVSSVLVTRVWAVYERDRRVLALMLTAFLCIFVPAWILSFRGFAHNSQQRDMDTLMYNYAYLGMAKAMGQREVDKLWPLTRCFLPHFPKEYPYVIVASLCFESESLWFSFLCRGPLFGRWPCLVDLCDLQVVSSRPWRIR